MKSLLFALLIILIPLVSFPTEITITAKSAGDAFTAAELNQILGAIQLGTYNIKTASATINKATIEILRIGSTDVTSTGVELNYLDGSFPGEAVVSKAVVLSSTGYIKAATLDNIYIINTGGITLPSGATFTLTGTSVTSTGVELNYLDGSFPGLTVASTAQVVSSTKSQAEVITGTLTVPVGGVVTFSGKIYYATSVVFSTTTSNTICLPMPTIDGDDWIFPSLQYGTVGLESTTYIVGVTPIAGAVQILLSSAPMTYGSNIRINILALVD